MQSWYSGSKLYVYLEIPWPRTGEGVLFFASLLPIFPKGMENSCLNVVYALNPY